ncbi:molybdopterin-binding protein [Leifsonia sp. ALI-44-B]|uniref:molybdopterin-dependent oxidoreductase n=1 Tax=Leifsonia sp. ALI-44-B TaxID=1933776 RepID=UPI00097BF423|nr:molybdopterin-dependent oxidoreductase [Leifsonia sp. ALI-44-B]ONI61546.1 molybdopterin-binding protein [Leifsonia sp. ALI-44-B]
MRFLLYRLRRSIGSPSRNPRMATVTGRLLGLAFLICFGTGLYSHFLQEPLAWMTFTTRPLWLYQVTQGIHITAGILCFPLLLGKLYVVFPDLFQYPPVRSLKKGGAVDLLERGSIALFVGASLVEITIGLLNTFQLYIWPFGFRQVHYALAYVIIGSLAIHIAVKLPVIRRYWFKGRMPEGEPVLASGREDAEIGREMADARAASAPFAARGITGRVFDWIDTTPAPDKAVSRRGFVATLAVAAAALVAFTGGQSFRVLDRLNAFAPRKAGIGPQSLPINRTAAAAKVTETAVDPGWTLTIANGDRSIDLSYADLTGMPQTSVDLPIACVEGWSQMASWRGVRMSELAALVGATSADAFKATSLETNSRYGVMTMGPEYVNDPLTLVAVQLNGEPLDIDHGYPARMIAPGRPGVLQTKWLSRLEVTS